MQKISYFFGCHLGQVILTQTDNLSKALQNKDLSAVEGQELASYVLETLQGDRCDERFDLFWELTLKKVKNVDVEEPELLRSRKRPRRYEEDDEPYAHENPKDKYKSIYFEALNFVINAIQDRFNQPDFKMYAEYNFEVSPWRKCCGRDEKTVFNNNEEEVSFESLFKVDIDMALLSCLLPLMFKLLKDMSPLSIHVIIEDLRKMSIAKRSFISEVITLIKLLLVAPARH